jgi:uncharacterized protein YdeI (BOF family)
MKGLTSFVGLLAIGVWIHVGISNPNAFADQSKMKEGSQGIQSQSPQQQQADQQRLKQQNADERQRLQAPDRSAEAPPYQENQPIGGQKEAGPADFPQPAFPFVKGQLMQIEGDYYVLRDAEGKEVRVHVDKSTKMTGTASVGDTLEVQRTLQGHALMIKPASGPLASPPSSASSGAGSGSTEKIVKDEQVSLGGAKQAVRGEVLKIDGDNYVIKDGHGNEVRLTVNPNTRLLCSQAGSVSGLLPAPSASDKPGLKGQPQDLAKTNEQQGSEVGPGTKSEKEQAGAKSDCAFKKGDMIEAEISDMGAATFIKMAGRPQPGQPLP